VLNTAALARRAGLNRYTLASKLRRGTKFTDEEARKIRDALAL
jgi:lambda repressor-like predicted transcriptional regulator